MSDFDARVWDRAIELAYEKGVLSGTRESGGSRPHGDGQVYFSNAISTIAAMVLGPTFAAADPKVGDLVDALWSAWERGYSVGACRP